MTDLELSSRERHQLLSVLRELDRGAPPESRKHERRRVTLDIEVRKIGGPGGVSLLRAKLVNVSAQGLGLVLAKPLQAGDRVAIPLRFEEGGGWLTLCEVRNTTRLESGQHRAGLNIVDRVEDPNGTCRVPMDWVL